MAKSKYFKLGAKASSFTYPSGNLTILPGQKVEISQDLQRHPFVADAIRGGHIKEVTSSDEKALVDTTSKEETTFNISRAGKAEIAAEINKLDPEEYDDIDDLMKYNKSELINIYNSLTEEDEEEEDEEDEDEDDK